MLFCLFFLSSASSRAEEFSTDQLKVGAFTRLTSPIGTWSAPESTAAVVVPPNQNRRSIHYWGTPDQYLVLELAKPVDIDVLQLDVERWTSAAPFQLTLEARFGKQWKAVLSLDGKTPTGFNRIYPASVNGKIDAIRFQLNSKKNLGILIHSLDFVPKGPMMFEKIELSFKTAQEPILLAEDGKARPADLQNVQIFTRGLQNPFPVGEVAVELKNAAYLRNLSLLLNGKEVAVIKNPRDGLNHLFPKVDQKTPVLTGNRVNLSLRAEASDKAMADKSVDIRFVSVMIGLKEYRFKEKPLRYLFGILLRDSGWDGAAGYRIPGLVTSNKGTLLAVYDIRHRNHNDLPDDIDIGLSRSFDGGKTWKPMQVAMNRTGADETKEGVGDPTILVDKQTGRIWIAALWAHNGFSTYASKPGLHPETSGQMDLVYSDDDGKTWSQPYSITGQAARGKDWCLLFQGPGMGITMRDGTLVFPAQFIDKDRKWYSTIVWSKDHGKSWQVGTGARPGTCEAQVVELNDGALMITMRNFKEHVRSIATTRDLGKTWTEHPTSLKALPDPICQASLLRIYSVKDGDSKNLLAFCNPFSATRRDYMSIQFSEDEGMTWKDRFLLNKNSCYGYSCMTMIDRETLGILYESSGGLIFQRVKLDEILNANQ